MKRFSLSIVVSILLAVAFTACVSQKSSVPGVSSIRAMPGNDIFQADMDIPEFEGEEELNTLISDKINSWYNDFITEAEINRSIAEDFGQPFTFENQWRVTMNTSDCASILLTAYQFTGGANGVDSMASFTWNKLTNKAMSITDFLYLVLPEPSLESLAQVCRQELSASLGADNDPSILDMIDSGTEPVAKNYDIFTISDKGLTVYFEKYQVAPGSAGSQAVLIPYLK